jgi:hypothetical protein
MPETYYQYLIDEFARISIYFDTEKNELKNLLSNLNTTIMINGWRFPGMTPIMGLSIEMIQASLV